jgi:outer membrane protein OmpA-like peptidoglycan-associated protein
MEASSPVETTPIDKDLRFQFAPNDARLDPDASANGKYIESLAGLLRAGVGSRILLIGHVEGSMIPQFRQKGEAYLKAMDRSAVSLSRNRAKSVKDTLVEKYGITPERIETTGKGWTEPLGAAFDLDRRVQAQWVTVN